MHAHARTRKTRDTQRLRKLIFGAPLASCVSREFRPLSYFPLKLQNTCSHHHLILWLCHPAFPTEQWWSTTSNRKSTDSTPYQGSSNFFRLPPVTITKSHLYNWEHKCPQVLLNRIIKRNNQLCFSYITKRRNIHWYLKEVSRRWRMRSNAAMFWFNWQVFSILSKGKVVVFWSPLIVAIRA